MHRSNPGIDESYATHASSEVRSAAMYLAFGLAASMPNARLKPLLLKFVGRRPLPFGKVSVLTPSPNRSATNDRNDDLKQALDLS